MTFLFINKDYNRAKAKLDRRRKDERQEIQTKTQIFDAKVQMIMDESQRRVDERNARVPDGTSIPVEEVIDAQKLP